MEAKEGKNFERRVVNDKSWIKFEKIKVAENGTIPFPIFIPYILINFKLTMT